MQDSLSVRTATAVERPEICFKLKDHVDCLKGMLDEIAWLFNLRGNEYVLSPTEGLSLISLASRTTQSSSLTPSSPQQRRRYTSIQARSTRKSKLVSMKL